MRVLGPILAAIVVATAIATPVEEKPDSSANPDLHPVEVHIGEPAHIDAQNVVAAENAAENPDPDQLNDDKKAKTPAKKEEKKDEKKDAKKDDKSKDTKSCDCTGKSSPNVAKVLKDRATARAAIVKGLEEDKKQFNKVKTQARGMNVAYRKIIREYAKLRAGLTKKRYAIYRKKRLISYIKYRKKNFKRDLAKLKKRQAALKTRVEFLTAQLKGEQANALQAKNQVEFVKLKAKSGLRSPFLNRMSRSASRRSYIASRKLRRTQAYLKRVQRGLASVEKRIAFLNKFVGDSKSDSKKDAKKDDKKDDKKDAKKDDKKDVKKKQGYPVDVDTNEVPVHAETHVSLQSDENLDEFLEADAKKDPKKDEKKTVAKKDEKKDDKKKDEKKDEKKTDGKAKTKADEHIEKLQGELKKLKSDYTADIKKGKDLLLQMKKNRETYWETINQLRSVRAEGSNKRILLRFLYKPPVTTAQKITRMRNRIAFNRSLLAVYTGMARQQKLMAMRAYSGLKRKSRRRYRIRTRVLVRRYKYFSAMYRRTVYKIKSIIRHSRSLGKRIRYLRNRSSRRASVVKLQKKSAKYLTKLTAALVARKQKYDSILDKLKKTEGKISKALEKSKSVIVDIRRKRSRVLTVKAKVYRADNVKIRQARRRIRQLNGAKYRFFWSVLKLQRRIHSVDKLIAMSRDALQLKNCGCGKKKETKKTGDDKKKKSEPTGNQKKQDPKKKS